MQTLRDVFPGSAFWLLTVLEKERFSGKRKHYAGLFAVKTAVLCGQTIL